MGRKIALIALGVVLLGSGFGWWLTHWRTGPWRPALSAREVATRVLGEQIRTRHPQAKVLVVGNPFTQRSGQSGEIYAFEEAAVRGLREGLGSPGALKLVYPELRPEFLRNPQSVSVDPKTTTPLSYLVSDDSFDRLVRENPGFGVLISLIGVPIQIRQSRLWTEPGQPSLALLLPDWRLLGGYESIRDAVKSGKIAAAVIAQPNAPSGEGLGRDRYREEFQRRFILVTRDNIDELLRTHTRLF